VQYDLESKPLKGLLVALVIVILWISSLEFFLFIDIAQLTPLWILPAILERGVTHVWSNVLAI
jgi:hypothetical protein